ncbi:unnamed protein product, partial [Ectocarpus sp. 8 AP-2014]
RGGRYIAGGVLRKHDGLRYGSSGGAPPPRPSAPRSVPRSPPPPAAAPVRRLRAPTLPVPAPPHAGAGTTARSSPCRGRPPCQQRGVGARKICRHGRCKPRVSRQ